MLKRSMLLQRVMGSTMQEFGISDSLKENVLRVELEQVYRQHRQSLFSLALTLVGCSGLAEDAVHEAFLRLCQKQTPPGGSLTTYVFAAVRNAAIDVRRRQQRQTAIVDSIFAVENTRKDRGTPDSISSVESADQNKTLMTAIDQLDELTRQILVMKIFSDMTFEEIGQVLERPGATVATRYRRAILRLEEKNRGIL